MMAKKGGAKAPPTYDSHNSSYDHRQKVNTLRDQFPCLRKEHISAVLDYFQFDADKAMDALHLDGGKEAHQKWSLMQNNQAKTNIRNKKRNKKKNKKDIANVVSTPAHGTDADDSSSLHSSNVDFDAEKESPTRNDEVQANDQAERKPSNVCSPLVDNNHNCDEISLSDPVMNNEISDSSAHTTSVLPLEERRNSTPDSCPNMNIKTPSDVPAFVVAEDRTSESPKGRTSQSPRGRTVEHQPQKAFHKQRHAFPHMTKSVTEDFTSDQSTSNQRKGAAYTKCKKDLSRQITSLPRIQSQLDTHLEDASKCLKNAFAEVRKMLDSRQTLMEQELENVKNEAVLLMKSRQALGAQLKMRTDKNLSDSEWNDLRVDIKQFVTERKYDEEVGKTIWFQYSIEAITEEIQRFGEIAPVKNPYSQRQHHRATSSTEPSSPVLVVESNDVPSMASYLGGDTAAAVEENNDGTKDTEEPKIEKVNDFRNKSAAPVGNRSRIFNNSSKRYNNSNNYQHNYGRYPHHRGRGYHQRGQMNNYAHPGRNFEYRQYSASNEHRQHYVHSERTDHHQPSEVEPLPDAPVNSSENKARQQYGPRGNHAYNKGFDQRGYRRPNSSYSNRHHQGRQGGNRAPRYNPSSTDVNADNSANYDREISQESKDMINGY